MSRTDRHEAQSHTLLALVDGIIVGILASIAFNATQPRVHPAQSATSAMGGGGVVITEADGTRYELPPGYGITEYDAGGEVVIGGTAEMQGNASARGQSIRAQGDEALSRGESTVPALILNGLFGDSGASAAISSFVSEVASDKVVLLLIVLGSVVMLAGPAGVIWGSRIGLGLSITQAFAVSACGVLLIGIGVMPEFSGQMIFGIACIGALIAALYVFQTYRAARVIDTLDRDATLWDELSSLYWKHITSSADADLVKRIETELETKPELNRAHHEL